MLADVLDVDLLVCNAEGALVASVGDVDALTVSGPLSESLASGRSIEADVGLYVAAALAGAEHLGTLVARTRAEARHGRAAHPRARCRRHRPAAVVPAFHGRGRGPGPRWSRRTRRPVVTTTPRGSGTSPTTPGRADRIRVVAVGEVHAGDLHRAGRAAARLGEAERAGGEHEGRLALLAASEGPSSERPDAASEPLDVGHRLQEALAGVEVRATVGVVALDTLDRAADLSEAWRHASTCVETLLTLGRQGDLSDPAGLGLARLVLGRSGPDELRDDHSHGGAAAGIRRQRVRRRQPWRRGSQRAGRPSAQRRPCTSTQTP